MSTAAVELERQELLERRKGFIGGSDCASMFSEGWGCQRRLVYDKQDVPPDYGRTPRELAILDRGTELEDVVVDLFVRKTGLKVRRQPTKYGSIPHAGVNIDRQIIGATQEKLRELFGFSHPKFIEIVGSEPGPGVFEAKTTNEWSLKQMEQVDERTNLPKGLPGDYVLQIEHALMVTGYKWGIFGVLEPTWWQYRWFPVVRNDKLISIIADKVQETWAHVEAGTLPEKLPAGDKRCKSCQWRRSCRTVEELAQLAGVSEVESDYEIDESLTELTSDYMAALEIAEEKEALVEIIKGELQKAIGDRAKVEVPALGVKISWKKQAGSMRWDSKALEATQAQIETVFAKLAKDEELVKKYPELSTLPGLLPNCKKLAAGSRPFKFMRF